MPWSVVYNTYARQLLYKLGYRARDFDRWVRRTEQHYLTGRASWGDWLVKALF